MKFSEQDAVTPVLLNARFILGERVAKLDVRGTGPEGLVVTVAHESRNQVVAFDFEAQHGAEAMVVLDQESITVLVRYEGHIAACGVYEVSLRQAALSGVLLVPCVTQGLLLAQDRDEEMSASMAELRKIISSSAGRGSLAKTEVAQ